MSYTMTHLVIANQYMQMRNFAPQEAGLFLIATVSPDSVHKEKNYNPHKKERSHFQPEGVAWGTIYEEAVMDRWYLEIKKFYLSRYSPQLTPMDIAFLQGYTVHLLVDIFNCKMVYAPNLIQYGLDVKKFRMEYRAQCLKYDHFLYQKYTQSETIFHNMKAAADLLESYPVLEHLGLREAISHDAIRRMVLDTEKAYKMEGISSLENAYMITEESGEAFIRETERQCEELLFDFPQKEHLFEVV